jgi:hypothetical protein
MKEKITNFVIYFLASPMESTMHHVSSFNSTNEERIEQTRNGISLVNGMDNIKLNVQQG